MFSKIRVGEHDDFDRLVLEFRGRGTPGWDVRYVKRGRQEGSGDVIPLQGEAVLQVAASGTTWPGKGYYSGPERLDPDGDVIEEVWVGGTFEGYTHILLGIDDGRTPFRVFTLKDPTRLVVDVRDD